MILSDLRIIKNFKEIKPDDYLVIVHTMLVNDDYISKYGNKNIVTYKEPTSNDEKKFFLIIRKGLFQSFLSNITRDKKVIKDKKKLEHLFGCDFLTLDIIEDGFDILAYPTWDDMIIENCTFTCSYKPAELDIDEEAIQFAINHNLQSFNISKILTYCFNSKK